MLIIINLLATTVVAAGTLNVTLSGRDVSVVFSGAENGSVVTFTVVAPSDTLPAGPFVLNREMTVVGGSVEFSFTLPAAAPSGTYTIRAFNNRVLHEVTFEFDNPEFLAAINSASNSTEVLAAIENFGDTIGLDISTFMLMNRAYRIRVAERVLSDRGTPFANNASATQSFDVAFALVSVHYSNASESGTFALPEVLRRNASVLGVNIDAVNSDYMRLTVAMRATFRERLAGRAFLTIDAFRVAFDDQILVAFFRAASWPGIQTYNTFDAAVRLNFDRGSAFQALTDRSVPYRAIVSGRNNINERRDIENLWNNSLTDSPPSGSGGSGGGGSSGGGFGGPPPNMTIVGDPPEQPGAQPIPPDYEPYVFTDLAEASWAIDYITELYELGIVNGIGDGLFAPNAQVTREQFLRMTVLAFGFDLTDGETQFSDVDPNAWYARYIKTAVEMGITNGISETEFGVGLNISRQDLIVMAYRALLADGAEFDEAAELTFYDSYMVAGYAVEALSVMVEAGIISGMGDNQLAPTANATRAQAARIIALAMWL